MNEFKCLMGVFVQHAYNKITALYFSLMTSVHNCS